MCQSAKYRQPLLTGKPKMRLIHLTDLHLTSLAHCALAQLRGKRWSGYLSWWKNRRWQHSADMLEQVRVAVAAENADRVLITGDLVHIGLPAEIAAAGDWLRRLASPKKVLLIPGNHDSYAGDCGAQMTCHWADYLHLPPATTAALGADQYPLQIDQGGLALIGLNSAVPAPLFMATGRLGSAQLQRLAHSIRAAKANSALVWVLIHHPPWPGQTDWRRALTDAPALAKVLTEAGADLVLHGHLHRNLALQHGALRIFGTASASSVVASRPASYRLFDVSRQAAGWTLRMQLKQAELAAPGKFLVIADQTWQVPLAPAH